MNVEPLVSVVMPSFNQGTYIELAIQSVLSQGYSHVELIVADGGSTDNTVAILQRYQTRDRRLRWFSRKDRGPAHAVNDAITAARGTTIGWLNSDDLYLPGALERTQRAFAGNPSWLMCYGRAQHIDASGGGLGDYPTLTPSVPVTSFAKGCFICQPTMFFRRSAFVLLGKLDETLKTSFDFDYWMRAFTSFQDRIGFVDAVQAYSRLHDNCITMRMRRTVALEGMQVLAGHLGAAPKEWLLTYLEEILAGDDADKPADLAHHMQSAIDEASGWMTQQEKFELEAAVTRRLT